MFGFCISAAKIGTYSYCSHPYVCSLVCQYLTLNLSQERMRYHTIQIEINIKYILRSATSCKNRTLMSKPSKIQLSRMFPYQFSKNQKHRYLPTISYVRNVKFGMKMKIALIVRYRQKESLKNIYFICLCQ